MATDFLLLQRYPSPGNARFRHYDWRGPAFTFGYSQKILQVREEIARLPPAGRNFGAAAGLCRRPTGGGIVDHRDDWTYTLVIPRGHPLEELPAGRSYRLIHLAIQGALVGQGVPALLAESAAGPSANACFERAEVHDVIHARSAAKIAGAAQKRNKQGLLFQGSILKSAASTASPRQGYAGHVPAAPGMDWERFHDDFVAELAKELGLRAVPAPWPDLNEDEVSALVERYASPEWMEMR